MPGFKPGWFFHVRPNRCTRCGILTGPDYIEEVLVGGVCGGCWRERARGIPDRLPPLKEIEEA